MSPPRLCYVKKQARTNNLIENGADFSKRIQPFILPFIIFTLITTGLYIFLNRSIYFPRVIIYRIQLTKLPFNTFMFYMLFFSVIRLYYINEFAFLCFMESKRMHLNVEDIIYRQLSELEAAYFSVTKLKSLVVKLEDFYKSRYNTVLKHLSNICENKPYHSEELEATLLSTDPSRLQSDEKNYVSSSDKELAQMVDAIRSQVLKKKTQVAGGEQKKVKMMVKTLSKNDLKVHNIINNLEDDIFQFATEQLKNVKHNNNNVTKDSSTVPTNVNNNIGDNVCEMNKDNRTIIGTDKYFEQTTAPIYGLNSLKNAQNTSVPDEPTVYPPLLFENNNLNKVNSKNSSFVRSHHTIISETIDELEETVNNSNSEEASDINTIKNIQPYSNEQSVSDIEVTDTKMDAEEEEEEEEDDDDDADNDDDDDDEDNEIMIGSCDLDTVNSEYSRRSDWAI